MAKTVGIYLYPETDQGILRRGDNRSHGINRDLERLYTLYRRTIRETPLALKEACLLVDALNGSLMDANTAHLLWASIEDACKLDGLAGKWEVDGLALVEKLMDMSAFQCMALIDAAERFWAIPDTERELEEGVRKCFNISE